MEARPTPHSICIHCHEAYFLHPFPSPSHPLSSVISLSLPSALTWIPSAATSTSVTLWHPPSRHVDGTTNDCRMDAAVRHRQPTRVIPSFSQFPSHTVIQTRSNNQNGRVRSVATSGNTRLVHRQLNEYRYKLIIHAKPVCQSFT